MADELNSELADRALRRRLVVVREMISRVFPPEQYRGPITPVDGEWQPELDEERDLYEALKGKNWTQIPVSVIDQNPDGVVLLTDKAFAAYVPAWLSRALDAFEGRNEVRELLTYCFGGSHGEPSSDHVGHLLLALTDDQLASVRTAMQLVADFEPDAFVRAQAERAVKFVDSIPRTGVR